MYLLAFFCEDCPHYQGVWCIRRQLKYLSESAVHFTTLYCREITWAIIVDCCHFFDQRLVEEDFAEQNIDWPRSLLNLTAEEVRQLKSISHFDLSKQWDTKDSLVYSPLTNQGRGNDFGRAPGGNANLGGGRRPGGNNFFGRGANQYFGNNSYDGNSNN